MPTSIPYDPSIVIGNIVRPEALAVLQRIATLQADVDAAQDDMNSLISLQRSLGMTIQELNEMGVDTKPIHDAVVANNAKLAQAGANYAKITADHADAIRTEKAKIRAVHSSPESPIDYNRTQIKRMPIAADTLKMDVQYFSFDRDQQSAASFVSQIGGFVSNSLSVFGDDFASTASGNAKNQTASQVDNHDVVGTLVLSLACTHKDAVLLAPFMLDVDKAIRVWNTLFPSDRFDLTAAGMAKLVAQTDSEDSPGITLVSGATYGSSFVGMVHVLRSESTSSAQSMSSIAASLQETFSVGCVIEKEQGGFGMDASMAADVKNLLSQQQISSHVSLVTMGMIPSIKSNELQIGVKTFADFDPDKMMSKLAVLANASSADMKSLNQSADAARTGQTMVALEQAQVASVMTGLGQIDDGKNKVLDINSMMDALQDYVDKAAGGNIGVPINYYLKTITKIQLGQMWAAKYFPGKYMAIQGDDAPVTQPTQPNNPPPVPGPAQT